MDISAEKEEIIRRFNLIHDVDLIKAIKSLLDFGLHKQKSDDIALNTSMDRAISDSKRDWFALTKSLWQRSECSVVYELPNNNNIGIRMDF